MHAFFKRNLNVLYRLCEIYLQSYDGFQSLASNCLGIRAPKHIVLRKCYFRIYVAKKEVHDAAEFVL